MVPKHHRIFVSTRHSRIFSLVRDKRIWVRAHEYKRMQANLWVRARESVSTHHMSG